MRAIEAEVNLRRGETELRTDIPITNFRGIELRDFPAEIARLALIIAKYQCGVRYRGQKEALAEFLPLDTKNARLGRWLSVCEWWPVFWQRGYAALFAHGAPVPAARGRTQMA